MYCLSIFGFFIIFFSFYLLIFVPTKLNNFTRFVIHGHDLTSGITQLFITLGTTPTFLFPCTSGYVNGFLSNFGMEPLNQQCIQVVLMTISRSFSLLLTINRAFAISSRMAKYKNLIVITFFAQLVGQVVFSLINGYNTEDNGEEARKICLAMIPYEYPKVMYTFRGYDVSAKEKNGQLTSLVTGLTSAIYMIVAIVCVCILVQSIRKQAKSSQSTQFLANQRRITFGILYFMIVEFVGLSIPFIVISLCFMFSVGNTVVSDYAFISMAIYPIFGPYYVLMSNTDYRNKVRGMLNKAQELGTRTFSVCTSLLMEWSFI